ncbi:MAG: acylphosphatase [Candidatus Limnocylindrales bacterium]
MNQRQRLDATVHGRVQGVGFRWFVRHTAARLRLVGWVANETSGSVRVVVEGETPQIEEMAAELRQGPPGAIVDRVEASSGPPTGEFTSFVIRARGHSGD